MASFKISRRYTRVGAVVYSRRVRKVFGFNTYNNKRYLMKAIDRIPYLRSITRTGYALSFARRNLFNSRRRNSKQVLIVMTDGISNDRVRGSALALKRAGVEVFAIGIGKNYNIGQLMQIASTKRQVYVAGFRNLQNIVRVIKSKACKGMAIFASKIVELLFILFEWIALTIDFLEITSRMHFPKFLKICISKNQSPPLDTSWPPPPRY